MKIKTIEVYETSDGGTVKTIREWKEAEITFLLAELPDPLTSGDVRDRILGHDQELIDILQVKDTAPGRPKGAKDRAPRRKSQPSPASDLDGPKGESQ